MLGARTSLSCAESPNVQEDILYYHSTVVLRNLVHEFSWWELSNFGKLTNHMSFHPESQM